MTRFLNIFCGVAHNMCNAEVTPNLLFNWWKNFKILQHMAGSIFSLHLIICIDSHNCGFVFSMNLEKIKTFTIISSRFII